MVDEIDYDKEFKKYDERMKKKLRYRPFGQHIEEYILNKEEKNDV